MLHNGDLAYLLASLSPYPHTPYSPSVALSCSIELHVPPVCTQPPPLRTSPSVSLQAICFHCSPVSVTFSPRSHPALLQTGPTSSNTIAPCALWLAFMNLTSEDALVYLMGLENLLHTASLHTVAFVVTASYFQIRASHHWKTAKRSNTEVPGSQSHSLRCDRT